MSQKRVGVAVASLLFVGSLLYRVDARGGSHIGNIVLLSFDDGSPMVKLVPGGTARLAVRTCGENTPTLVDFELVSGVLTAPLDSDMGEICWISVSTGNPVDVVVGAYSIGEVSPVPMGLDQDELPVEDLVGAALRLGTSTGMGLARSIAAVPRQATSSELEDLEEAFSVLALDLP